MNSSSILFESGIMKISDFNPIHGRYETRTLQLPSLPLFDQLDLSLFEPSPTHHNASLLSSSTATLTPNTPRQALSRFIECFELQDPATTSTIKSSTSLRSRKSTSSKKAAKAPRRCYSNPTLSKKDRLIKTEPSMEPPMPRSNAPKRSLSNAFHALSGLLPKSKRRADADDDQRSVLSATSTTTTIRQAWQSMTYLDEMKTSVDHGTRQPLSSRYQTRSWWTDASDICVKS
ncbi:hypothetical protein [Absidia glauca]|uniref:Uncharacterized protein n=1 Tax=Absidia glauca TaxID=4829 RepID=A0A163JB73_ABSGL|nr:hypothetical protein [Absidia glauca]